MSRRAGVLWWACADWLYAARWQARSLRRAELPQDYRRGGAAASTVVLVPGVYESWRFLQPLADALHAGGHAVHVVSELGFNSGQIPQTARTVRRYVDDQGLVSVDLVGHSKGGLIGKQLLVHHNADGRFDRLVAVNTPFSGSTRARYLPLRGVRVFVPGGALLGELAAASSVNRQITSVYSALDPNIPGTSELPGARNVRIETIGHFRVLSDPRVHAAVLDALCGPGRARGR